MLKHVNAKFRPLSGMKKVFVILGLLVVGFAVYKYVVVKPHGEDLYNITEAKRADLRREAYASGKVESPTKVNLHFKNSGTLTALRVKAGDSVVEGAVLAKQDTAALDAQLREMEASVDAARARLAQLLAGASSEDRALAETAVSNAAAALQSTRQLYRGIVTDAFTKIDDAIRSKIDPLFVNPRVDPRLAFTTNDAQLKIDLEALRTTMESRLVAWDNSLASVARADDLVPYTVEARKNLDLARALYDKMTLALNNVQPSGSLSQSTLEMWRANISQGRAIVSAATVNLADAETKLIAAESGLATARDLRALKEAPARSADVALAEAQVRQSEASIERVRAQIAEMTLVAPANGVITETNGEVGENVTPAITAVALIPRDTLQIKVDISENDVVNIAVGQEARITLDAFGNDVAWKGKVIRIDPAETVVAGAIYYKTTVVFDSEDARVRPGMTANVWVTTAYKQAVIAVPLVAVKESEGKKYVEVFARGGVVKKEVNTGIRGEGGVVEITAGVNEGDAIVLGAKQ